jgi:ATP-dependent Clp protease ATP-binding subunit ClpC
MFERFSDEARRVVVGAQEDARIRDHNYIGSEHLLLALVRDRHSVACRALESMGVDLADVRAQVDAAIGTGGSAPPGHIPFTPSAKKVLELALREALQLEDNFIGTEHILLGIVREGDGVGAGVLATYGVEL